MLNYKKYLIYSEIENILAEKKIFSLGYKKEVFPSSNYFKNILLYFNREAIVGFNLLKII